MTFERLTTGRLASTLRARATGIAILLAIPPTLAVAGGGAWAAYLQLTGNFHAVRERVVYRSNTLSPEMLDRVVREEGIRAVLNLRGANPGRDWYRAEATVLERAGVRLIDFPLSANRELTDRQIRNLVTLLRRSPKPLLIHCQSGSDRTGLAAALYGLAIAGRPADAASGQLSFAYGHFPWLWSRSGAVDRAFQRAVEVPAVIAPVNGRGGSP